MKKLLTVLLGVLMVLSLAGCGNQTTDEPTTDVTAANTYADYVAAEAETELELLMYVQGHQGWWTNDEGKGVVSVYAQNDDGGFFCYNMFADEATAEALVPGTLIKVKGYKAEFSGELELSDATVEIVEGAEGKVYEAVDLTDNCGDNEALATYMNQKACFKALQVSADGWTYGWDGSGTEGDDIYLNLVCPNDARMTFVVESYLTGKDTDVYKTVQSLTTGDLVDITCFMYWYEGAQPHIIDIKKVSE